MVRYSFFQEAYCCAPVAQTPQNVHQVTRTYKQAREEGVFSYIGYLGMCSPQKYRFSAVLVINSVLILADFGHE